MKTWIKSQVVGKQQWTATLSSLQLDAPLVEFSAGQFIQVTMDMDDMRVLLEARGLWRNSGKRPGHYTTEQYC